MKRIILLAITILLILTSCKEKEITENPTDVVETKEIQGMTIVEEVGMKNVFSSVKNFIPSGGGFFFDKGIFDQTIFDKCFIYNDRVYFGVIGFKPEIKSGYDFAYLNSYDLNGDYADFVLINPVNEEAQVKFMWYDSQGNLIIIEELDYVYTLSKFADSGELVFSAELDSVKIYAMVIGGAEDNIYIASADNKITVFSPDGKILWQTTADADVISIVSAHGKTPILKMNNTYTSTVKYQYIDVESQKLTDIEMPHKEMYVHLYSNIAYGDGYDYYHIYDNGVYGYDIASNTLTKVLDWINSDLIFSNMRMLTVISPETIFYGEHDLSDYKYKTSMLKHIPNDRIPQKTYISIGCITGLNDEYLTKVIADFNRKSTEYRLTLTNFLSRNEIIDPIHLRLNNEIAAGNAPDLLYINHNIPMLAYTKNGLFENIKDYLADEPILSENLLPFATESAEINGVLPQMITKFKINTLIAKSKNFPNKTGWSIGDMLRMYKSKDILLTYELSRNFLDNYVLDNIVSECIDYTNGKCDFSKQGFRDYIELYGLLPEYFDYRTIGDYNEFTKDNFAKCRNDEMLVGTMSVISNVLTYMNEKRQNFRDEDSTVIGFPTMNGDKSGDYIQANGFAIFKTSANKAGAWEFIKYCLSDEFASKSTSLFVMQPTKSSLRIQNDWYRGQYQYYPDATLGAASMSSISNFDYEAQYGSGVLEQINDEWIDEFNSYIESADNFVYRDKDVADIINNELSAYAGTGKPIDAAIDAIQRRMAIYMSEMWE